MANPTKTKYVTDLEGKKIAVVIAIKEYEKMIDELDDYYCRKEYDRVKPKTDKELEKGEFITLDDYCTKRSFRNKRKNVRKSA
ncbi:MAG: hypothetical protein QME25_05180 [Bacteroidota bacterium]|nr:hypothetical protein [Bacteroidota bacterium]